MKALAITFAAGAALCAGSLPLQPSSRLQRATSRLGQKRALGSAVGIAAGGGPMTYRPRAYYGSGPACPAYGSGWLGYGPAWYADGYGAGLYGRWC